MGSGNRWADIGLGTFVLAALLMLMVGSLWIAGLDLFGGEKSIYQIRMRDSGGITTGDRVRFAGMEVGRVEEMTLEVDAEWPILIAVAVRSDLPIKVDSVAGISTSGLLGASYLQIRAGSPEAALLPAGGEIPGHASLLDETLSHVDEIGEKGILLMDQLSGLLDQISGEVDPLMAKIDRLLSDENIGDIEAVLASLRTTMEESGPRISSTLERLETVAARVEEGADRLPEITDKVTVLLDDVRSSLGPDGERIARVLDQAETSLASADDVLSMVGANRRELEWTLSDLRDLVSNLKAFSQTIKRRPYSLVRIRHPRERSPGDNPGADGQ